jgi:hypothetical protein
MMRQVDPTIRLAVCGSVEILRWNRVPEELVNLIDFISVHDHEGVEDYYEIVGSVPSSSTTGGKPLESPHR